MPTTVELRESFVALTSEPASEKLIRAFTAKSTRITYPVGTRVLVEFGHVTKEQSSDTWFMRLTTPDGHKYLSRRATLVYLAPQVDELSDDGVAKSILGENVEPDGFDADGSPSWLLALGLI